MNELVWNNYQAGEGRNRLLDKQIQPGPAYFLCDLIYMNSKIDYLHL